MTILYVLLAVIVFCFLVLYVLYLIGFRGRIFYNDVTKNGVLDSPQYSPYKDQVIECAEYVKTHEDEEVSVKSYDGLVLKGSYYSTPDPRGVMILFHGYRSVPGNDFSCSLKYLKDDLGFDIILVDERAHWRSGGRTITFGVKERMDCLTWARYATERWPDKKIILYGVSMGGATVMMAADLDLPDKVAGIVEDCGYTSPKDIIVQVLRRSHLPGKAIYALGKIGAMIYGGFNPDSSTALQSMKNCGRPILFIHGEDDRFVPCEMGRECYEACTAEIKHIVTVPDAGHGLSYMVDNKKVTDAMKSFFEEISV